MRTETIRRSKNIGKIDSKILPLETYENPWKDFRFRVISDKGITLSNNSVVSWLDQSPNGHNFSAGVAPEYVLNQIAGKPCLRFANSHYLHTPHTSSLNLTNHTIFLIVRYTAGTVIGKCSTQTSTGEPSNRRRHQVLQNSIRFGGDSPGEIVFPRNLADAWQMLLIRINANNNTQTVFLNELVSNSTRTLSSLGLFNDVRFNIGCAFQQGAETFIGDLAEFILWDEAISDLGMQHMKKYAAIQWLIKTT